MNRRFEPSRQDVMIEFLGALAGLPIRPDRSPAMRAAQNDPGAMQEQKRRAFAALIDAELDSSAIVILLEDLHWGDAPSIQYLHEALLRPGPRALFVLALGRPEVRDRLPALGFGSNLQEIRLSALTPRASERLVRAALGEATNADVVAGIVERSAGNAFFLEELMRSVADGQQAFPDTVLALAQSRLEQIAPDARRVLRAASVYGGAFSPSAIAALLEGDLDPLAWLDVLESRELLVSTSDVPGRGERSYAFRHAILRDAAYAMLTESDRRQAHRLAADWLQASANPDAGMVAEHLEHGGETARAIPWLARAATLALGCGDLSAAVARATRGIALGATGVERGLLRVMEGLAHAYSGFPASAASDEALTELVPGTSLWWSALAISFYDAGTRGAFDRASELAMLAFSRGPGDELTGPYAMAVNAVVAGMLFLGQMELGGAFLERIQEAASRGSSGDPLFLAWLDAATSLHLAHWTPDGVWQLERALSLARTSAVTMTQSGSVAGEAQALFYESLAAMYLGLYERMEETAFRSMELAERSHAGMTRIWAQIHLAAAYVHTDRVQSGIDLLLSLDGLDMFQTESRHVFLAYAYLLSGRTADAKREADEACAGPANFMNGRAASVSAQALLAFGRPAEAIEVADQCKSALPWWSADLLTTKALALHALGHKAECIEAASAARIAVARATQGIENPTLRASALQRVPELVRTLTVADRFGVG